MDTQEKHMSTMKRTMMMVMAGAMAAQVTFAMAAGGTFPESAENLYGQPLPSQERYFEQHPTPVTAADDPSEYPASAQNLRSQMLPSQERYFGQHQVTGPADPIATVIPHGEQDYTKMFSVPFQHTRVN
jgi:hypothetical protein